MDESTACWLVLEKPRNRPRTAAPNLRIGLAASFVLAATSRVVSVVDQNVVVACGADDAVYCLAELLVSRRGGMFLATLLSANCHSLSPVLKFNAVILEVRRSRYNRQISCVTGASRAAASTIQIGSCCEAAEGLASLDEQVHCYRT